MSKPLVSQLLTGLRSKLGITELAARLTHLASQLDSLDQHLDEISRTPRGPVYLGDHTALTVTTWGGLLLVDTRESVLAPALLSHRQWEPALTEWFLHNLRPGQTFVDVGANIGYYSVLAARQTGPSGHVVAVEAHPRMVELLRRNLILNGFGTTTVRHAAAWSRSTSICFHQREHFGANSSVGSLGAAQLDVHGDAEEVIKVDTLVLDELLDELPAIDILKVDIEGSEVQAIRGARRILASNPDLIVIFEWSPGQIDMVGDEPSELLDLFEEQEMQFHHVENAMAQISRTAMSELNHANVMARRRNL